MSVKALIGQLFSGKKKKKKKATKYCNNVLLT